MIILLHVRDIRYLLDRVALEKEIANPGPISVYKREKYEYRLLPTAFKMAKTYFMSKCKNVANL